MLTTATTLAEAYGEVAAQHPGREALVCGEDRLTYGELAARAAAMGEGLKGLGIGKGDLVASVLPPGLEYVTLFFGLMRLGAVIVPINPQFRRRQLSRILAEAEPAALVLGGKVDLAEDPAAIAGLAREIVPGCRQVSVGGEGASALPFAGLLDAPCPSSSSLLPVGPDDLAAILYTSGTTGRPKGVMHSHRGLISPVVSSVRLRRMWLKPPTPAQLARMAGLVGRYGTRLLQAAGRPQTFLTAVGGYAIAGVEVILQALLMGDRLILMPRFHPIETLRWIERERVTIVVAAPLALSVLVRVKDLRRYDTSSLLICGTGAAPCPPELARQLQQRFGCAVHIGYGTTEIGGGISATSIEDSAQRQAETVGRPMDGVEVRVVDEQRRPLPPGQVGELACRGEARMLGYYRSPELTEQVLDAEGWYYTGDLAVMDEQGFIRIVDRKKDVIIRGGQNIYPAEIEEFLAAHEAIHEAAVVGVTAPGGGERVWAFVRLEEGARLSPREVLTYCRAELEAYKIPDQVRLVEDLPRSALGKVAKAELRAMAAREMGQGIARPQGREEDGLGITDQAPEQ